MADTTATLALALKAGYWNSKFLKELREELFFYDLGMKSPYPMNEGKVVHWIALADLTAATSLSESFDPTAFSLSAGDVSATLTQYGGYVSMSDFLMDTEINTTMENIMERLGRHAAKTLDIVIRDSVFSAATCVKYGGTAVARNSIATDGSFDATVATVRKAVNFFQNANAMPVKGNDYAGIVHPDVVYDLQGDSNWVNAHLYTEKGVPNLYSGEVGSLYGVRFMRNTNALKMVASGSASTDVYQSYYVADQGFGVSELYNPQTIVKNPLPSSPLNLTSTAGWKTAFATKQLKTSALLRYETGASQGN